MLTYFEVKERLDNLTKFRNLYREYIDFTNRSTNVPAQIVRRRMEPLVPMAVDSLRRVGLGSMITRDAPVKGGRKIQINLVKAVFRDHIIRQFSLDDQTPLDILDKGVLRYKQHLWAQKIQLFNPLFWLFHFGLFLARLPVLIFEKAGYDTTKAERFTSARFYLVLFQLVFFYIIAKWVGLVGWIRFDILGL